MEENTLQRVRDRLREALSVPYVQKAVLLGIAALSGFLSARGLVFGKYAPFAAAAAASSQPTRWEAAENRSATSAQPWPAAAPRWISTVFQTKLPAAV